jgi:hypothetical protein
MNVIIENHRWIQDSAQTKSALCFERGDLPPEWTLPLQFVRFESQVRGEGKGDTNWRVTVNVAGEEHALIFPVHIQLLNAQAKLYSHITLVVLDDQENWAQSHLLEAPRPADVLPA